MFKQKTVPKGNKFSAIKHTYTKDGRTVWHRTGFALCALAHAWTLSIDLPSWAKKNVSYFSTLYLHYIHFWPLLFWLHPHVHVGMQNYEWWATVQNLEVLFSASMEIHIVLRYRLLCSSGRLVGSCAGAQPLHNVWSLHQLPPFVLGELQL